MCGLVGGASSYCMNEVSDVSALTRLWATSLQQILFEASRGIAQ